MGSHEHADNLTLLCTEAARQIVSECGSSAEGDARAAHPQLPGLHGCGTPFVRLLGRQAALVLACLESGGIVQTIPGKVDRRLTDLIEIAHARFYAFVPDQVPVCWRQLYTDASILQFAQRWLRRAADHQANERLSERLSDLDSWDDWDDLGGALIRPLDMALILAGGAGPAHRGRAWIHAALDELHALWDETEAEKEESGREESKEEEDTEHQPRKRRRTDGEQGSPAGPPCHDWSTSPTFDDWEAAKPPKTSSSSSSSADVSSSSPFAPPVRHPVPRSGPLGLEGFQAYLDQQRKSSSPDGPQPLVLTGMTDHWPARQRSSSASHTGHPWSVPAYLRWRTIGGRRLVPVELGRSYVDDGWTQAVVPFADVLDELLGRKKKTRRASAPGRDDDGPMYLAQHALFSQMPRLREDILIPDACYTITGGGGGGDVSDEEEDDNNDDVLINAWLGPPGTITPLHTDPHHNLLAQVVGRKYVRLYAPAQTAALRPRGTEAGGIDMGNTSTLDVGVAEGWDRTRSGNGGDDDIDAATDERSEETNQFRQIPYVDCILEPGDTLYIPQGWWHYVRGLTVSFSVSFWWN